MRDGGGTQETVIVWFRRDLRLRDNPALWFAAKHGRAVVPVYVHAPGQEGTSAEGAAAQWWLERSLAALSKALGEAGSSLILRHGCPVMQLKLLRKETGSRAVYWNRRYEPELARLDGKVEAALRADGCDVKTFNGGFLFDPEGIRNREGKPFRVFTPFWKRCLENQVEAPFPVPFLRGGVGFPASVSSSALKIATCARRSAMYSKYWEPGVAGAEKRLERFMSDALRRYLDDRDYPALEGVSKLSPHIHFGEIGIREIWTACRECARVDNSHEERRNTDGFLRQLGWREFSCYILHHFPETVNRPFRQEFESFPWSGSASNLRIWKTGQTGFPMVDAGMRQLEETGWMHNRVRMIVASFLVKHLLVSWRDGAEWFWESLVDADLANNTMGWQWSAGSGADPAPYFRIFNPALQGRKFDPAGEYVRRWVPELAKVPERWMHSPFEAPGHVLRDAGVRPGRDYPRPIVDHKEARLRALSAFRKIRS